MPQATRVNKVKVPLSTVHLRNTCPGCQWFLLQSVKYSLQVEIARRKCCISFPGDLPEQICTSRLPKPTSNQCSSQKILSRGSFSGSWSILWKMAVRYHKALHISAYTLWSLVWNLFSSCFSEILFSVFTLSGLWKIFGNFYCSGSSSIPASPLGERNQILLHLV